MSRRLFLHIGLQKTGTSFVQRVLWDSQQALEDAGVSLVPGTKLAMFRLMLDVRGRYNPGIDPPAVGEAVRRFPEQLAAARDTALVTQESLSAATPDQIDRLLAAAADREVHVVVTVRDLGRLIPSAWQQTVQSGRSRSMAAYVERLAATDGTDARIWATMDLPRILGLWAARVPPERIHVVTVPPPGAPPRQLLERFCSVVGIDPAVLTIDESSRANRGLRWEQAELLREVNRLLPEEVRRRDVYGDVVKRYFAVSILGGDEGTAIRLPQDRRAWVASIAEQHIATVREGGFRVVGDLDELLPLPGAFADGDQRPDDAGINAVASQAIAAMLTDRAAERARAASGDGPAAPRAGRLRSLVRRLRGR